VVPVYNEDEILHDNTVCLIQYLEQVLDDFELILIENGSSDVTLVYAKLLKTKYARVKLITLPEHNLGEAIRPV
jgi:glycosyltransferase involved in cell wall biosynthesis